MFTQNSCRLACRRDWETSLQLSDESNLPDSAQFEAVVSQLDRDLFVGILLSAVFGNSEEEKRKKKVRKKFN